MLVCPCVTINASERLKKRIHKFLFEYHFGISYGSYFGRYLSVGCLVRYFKGKWDLIERKRHSKDIWTISINILYSKSSELQCVFQSEMDIWAPWTGQSLRFSKERKNAALSFFTNVQATSLL